MNPEDPSMGREIVSWLLSPAAAANTSVEPLTLAVPADAFGARRPASASTMAVSPPLEIAVPDTTAYALSVGFVTSIAYSGHAEMRRQPVHPGDPSGLQRDSVLR